MIKILIIIFSLLIGIFIGFQFNVSIGIKILLSFSFGLATIIAIGIIFMLILAILTLPINKKEKCNKQSKFYRRALVFYENFLFKLFGMKIVFNGVELTKNLKQFIVVGNHRSNLDSMVIDWFFKDINLLFIAKKSLFNIPFVGKLIHASCYAKLDRENINKDLDELYRIIDIASMNDYSVGVFPEGTRTIDYDVHEFKEGSFILSSELKCPILLCALRGTYEVNRNLLFKKHTVCCDFIELIPYKKYGKMSKSEIAKYCENKIHNFLENNKNF